MSSPDAFSTRPLLLLAFGAALLLPACSGVAQGDKDAGAGDGGAGPTVCSADTDCPTEKPVCEGGICSVASGGCQAASDCPSGVCNQLTGECEACTDCCASDTDCAGGKTCTAGHCTAPNNPCTTVADCAVDQICSGGNCAPWDPDLPCSVNTDCPRDHQCNSLGDARCEGCLTDAFCAASGNGPKCDVLDDGVGPGVGYCYPECGPGMPDCPATFICDTSRGGLCVPACTVNADCGGGLVCRGGKCETCTTDAQCEASEICSGGACVTNPGCNDAQCQSSLGQAYFCDTTTTTCKLGCSQSGCSGGINDCNPCPAGQTCDATTRQCSGGGGCTACPTDCTLTGQLCDTVTCTCQSAGGGGNGGVGSACLADTDCQAGLACLGGLPSFGIPGSCDEACTLATLCICANPAKTCANEFLCLLAPQPCQ